MPGTAYYGGPGGARAGLIRMTFDPAVCSMPLVWDAMDQNISDLFDDYSDLRYDGA